jgi:hypothetical protein
MRSTARLLIIGILFLPPLLLLSGHYALWLAFALLALFIAAVVRSVLLHRREEPLRKARIAAILAAKPDYVVYGSGAPMWLAIPLYAVFVLGALALIFWEAVFGPPTLHGFNGFLTVLMLNCAIPFAVLAATATWKVVAWHLRPLFPDKLLLVANDQGIGTSDGFVIPYARIRRIDPCSRRWKFGTDNWIEIDDGTTRQVHLNMVREPLDDILTKLRDHAKAGGAPLMTAYPNGHLRTTGSQLGYRTIGYGDNPWRAT